jgi:SAM-dependent methyltransferase
VLTTDATRGWLDAVPDGISEAISPNDLMSRSQSPEHYFAAGVSALRCIKLALLSANAQTPQRILDLPSGHGRVLRTLRAAFPDAETVACDIDRDGVDFCVSNFDATPVYSHDDPQCIDVDGTFDLIWCGSLLTHLPAVRWTQFLAFFRDRLHAHGILVFTTHGRLVVERLRTGVFAYGLDEAGIKRVLDGIPSGFGYADYFGQSGYGIAVSLPGWVSSVLQDQTHLRLLLYLEQGWNNHQDVIACIRQ